MPSLSPTLYLSVVLVLFHLGQTAREREVDTCKVDYKSESTPSLKMTKADIKAVFSDMFQTEGKLEEYCKMQGVRCNIVGFTGINYTKPTLEEQLQGQTSTDTTDIDILRRGKRTVRKCCETSRYYVRYHMVGSWYVVHFDDDHEIQYVHVARCVTGTSRSCNRCILDYSCHYLLVSKTDPVTPGSLSVSIKPFWFPSCCKCL